MSPSTGVIQSTFPQMKVDVALCGSAPRSSFRPDNSGSMRSNCSIVSRHDAFPSAEERMICNRSAFTGGPGNESLKPLVRVADASKRQVVTAKTPKSSKSISPTSTASANGDCRRPNLTNSPSKYRRCSSNDTADKDIPHWAVPAFGHSILLPIRNEGAHTNFIDLTEKSAFHFGRSPSSDIMLSHKTCSRRHAAVFHHPSGFCYLKDCQSSHGTFVNGVKVSSTTLTKLRSGSLIRFGGPGAESFLLKSFSTTFTRMVADVHSVVSGFESSPMRREVNQSGVACVRGDCGMACVASVEDAPVAALVLLNTRLNALGGTSTLSDETNTMVTSAKRKFEGQVPIFSSSDTLCEKEYVIPTKKLKLSPGTSVPQTTIFQDPFTFVTPSASAEFVPPKQRKVSFMDEKPTIYFPASVTPDNFSSDDEHSVGNEPISSSCAIMIR